MIYKQAIVVRSDLKMGKGKTAAQVAHAAVGAMQKSRKFDVEAWSVEGGKKVVLKVGSLRKLNSIQRKAKAARLPHFLVRDAGLTQIKSGTITCLGIGPVREDKLDVVIKDLKLL